jgi:hypothetical protein
MYDYSPAYSNVYILWAEELQALPEFDIHLISSKI